MEQFEYKYIGNAFSTRRVLRQVEAHEREGWSLYSLETTQFFILGSGGSAGLQAIMRRPVDDTSKAVPPRSVMSG